MWEQLGQLGAVAFVFVVFLILAYRLADKYLSTWARVNAEAKQAEIGSHEKMAESMQQITLTMRETSEFHNNNIREVLLAVKVLSGEINKMREILNDVRDTKA